MNVNADILKQIDEIRKDKKHGASELARQAIAVLKCVVEKSRATNTTELTAELQSIGQELISVRPAMAPVSNIVSRLLNIIDRNLLDNDLSTLKQIALSTADKLVDNSYKSTARIAEYGSSLIKNGFNIFTHSYSSTVIAVLREASRKYIDIKVIVTGSRLNSTGENTANELGECGIAVTYINGIAMGLYISNVNMVIVGADRICADGILINGIGTYLLALAADRAGVPFYVACDTLKFDPNLKGSEVDLEEKESSEIIEPAKLPAGTAIKNPYFDITPPEFIKAVITENGILTIHEVIDYMKTHLK